ncbi:MAG: hypothetical protein RLZZ630_703 [Bacteroidota bacterium]
MESPQVNSTNFVWGVSSSAPQTEGATERDGRGASIWDEFSKKRGKIAGGHTPGIGTGFYSNYLVDLDIVRMLGIRHFRFSISWSRVLPNGTGLPNTKGLDFYDRLVDACLLRGIEPWITLYHWDLPLALQKKGGWNNRDVVNWYLDYAETVLTVLADRVKNWMVLNEPVAFTGAGHFLGIHAPGKKGLDTFLSSVHHASLVQAAGIKQLQSIGSGIRAGTTFSCSPVNPLRENEKDIKAAKAVDAVLNRLFIEPMTGNGYPTDALPILDRIEKYIQSGDAERLKASPDFIGIQQYTRHVVRSSWMVPYLQAKTVSPISLDAETTALGWEIHPESLYITLKRFATYDGISSIYVTENGAAFTDRLAMGRVRDTKRINYLKSHIGEVLRARAEGIPVNGYFAWSLTDNFEWTEGYNARFGLVYIDYVTQRRFIKDSAYWYSELIHDFEAIQSKNSSCDYAVDSMSDHK